MKIIKIEKSNSSGSKIHYLTVSDDLNNETIEELVVGWCGSDSLGLSNGYHYKWLVEKNEKTIKSVLKDKINLVENKIEQLKNEKLELLKYLDFVENLKPITVVPQEKWEFTKLTVVLHMVVNMVILVVQLNWD